jgi:hypothetical protein
MSGEVISHFPISDSRASLKSWTVAVVIASGLLIAVSACASDSYSTVNGSVHVVAGRPA